MGFGYTDEKLDQRASCFWEQSHFWGTTPSLQGLGLFQGLEITSETHLLRPLLPDFIAVLPCFTPFSFFFLLILSTAIHLLFHSLLRYSSSIMGIKARHYWILISAFKWWFGEKFILSDSQRYVMLCWGFVSVVVLPCRWITYPC